MGKDKLELVKDIQTFLDGRGVSVRIVHDHDGDVMLLVRGRPKMLTETSAAVLAAELRGRFRGIRLSRKYTQDGLAVTIYI